MAQEVVVLPRDECQLAEENTIVLNHLVERLFAADQVFELRCAEHGSQPVSYTHLTLPTNREV